MLSRRNFLLSAGAAIVTLPFTRRVSASPARQLAITIDDPTTVETPLLRWQERNTRLLSTLQKHNIKAALFVCGKRIDSPEGRELVKAWDDAGHQIANHSYSHSYYHSNKITFEDYSKDALKGEELIGNYANFTKLFRFPYLKEGETIEKRDRMREWLSARGYHNGYVTLDASDWYIDSRLNTKLKADVTADTSKYRDFFLEHIYERAEYYDVLSRKVEDDPVKHTLLLHHSLLTALYLDDLLTHFTQQGWKLIDAQEAFAQPLMQSQPSVLPAGESLIYSLYKAKYGEAELRYPAEDGEYEKTRADELGL